MVLNIGSHERGACDHRLLEPGPSPARTPSGMRHLRALVERRRGDEAEKGAQEAQANY